MEYLSNPFIDVPGIFRIRRSNGEVAGLATKKHGHAFDGSGIYILLMSRRLESKFGVIEDGIDVLYPKMCCLGVSLQSMKNMEHKTTLKTNAVLIKVPKVGTVGAGVCAKASCASPPKRR